ncbi:YceI family protein [Mycobacterium aquaticum]|uniref:S-adenosyl-L-methionine-dependent methyltransferase n=1 Tax=Mycobacterium aquaticum TaxID=1927124 RepID=A0A1X0B246_9MYCO|nr:YceI family protein [Mycobacterium aquaticum]ORA36380.1 S-adenosyl-L-methionine-dependent methyltransferase [Mycobacterium aquaticum]
MGDGIGVQQLTGQWTLSASDGELLLHTGVTGTAARMGHRLTIAMRSWRATVDWDGDDPSGVEMTIDLDSLDVVHGEGGMTPLSGAEKTLVRTNALKTLQAKRFPQATFRSSVIDRDGGALRLVGTLQIAGRSGEQTIDVHVEAEDAQWRISGKAVVRHSAFGIKQYSMLMGAMKVADEVEITLAAARPR